MAYDTYILAKLVKYIPQGLRANKICRRSYYGFINNIETPVREYYRSINKYLFYARYGHKLKRFKDIHKGQRCFIIGNGPSILKQDLTKLKNEITFVVNWFALHEQYSEINPTYYCMAARDFFYDSDTNPQLRDSNIQLHKLLREKTGNAVKFLNYQVKPYVESHNLFPGHQVYYLNHESFISIYKRGMSQDITKVVYIGPTSIIDFCLHLAFYMGFSEVYLLGCDCTLQYQRSDSVSTHFHPDNPEWGTYKKLPPDADYKKHSDRWYDNAMKAYSVVKETFERHGRKVYNAGVGGKLEVFERVNYDELF